MLATEKEEKIVCWAIDDKEDWEREEEIKEDHRKIEEIVPRRFLKWKKVFGKVESKRMPTRKVWDHAIDLKKTFKSWKKRIYPLSKNKREEVQNFVEDQLRKGYIRPSKSPQTLLVFFVGKKDGSKQMVIDYRNLNSQICHDLAKWLSHYLYFFSFLFLFFYLGLTIQKEVQESVTQTQSHDRKSQCHITWWVTW